MQILNILVKFRDLGWSCIDFNGLLNSDICGKSGQIICKFVNDEAKMFLTI